MTLLSILGILLIACLVNALIDNHTISIIKVQPNHTLNAEIYTGIALVLAIIYVPVHKLQIWDIFWLLGMAWCFRAFAFNIILSLLRKLPWDYKSPALVNPPATNDPNSKVDEAINKLENRFGISQKIIYLGEVALTIVFALIVAIR